MTSAASLAKTPSPPYNAVIFTSQRTFSDRGYGRMADRMVELASKQLGFLDVESVVQMALASRLRIGPTKKR